ncbi:MAG: sel1 repeat family protein [Oscillospiraceae bacterium]|nr:sel1 repeat family protein [Oscillospiraceae bacterium]
MEKYLYEIVHHFAEAGDVASMKQIVGEFLSDGTDSISEEEAGLILRYLNMLVENDDSWAMLSLGSLYYTGFFELEQDYSKARFYYEKAAELSELTDSWALNNLGYCYYYGRAGDVDYKKAFECFSYAAIQGNANSMYKLGDMYYYGHHVENDVDAAFYWYTMAQSVPLAADSDYVGFLAASIAYRMGRAHLFGEGTEIDHIQALFELRSAETLFYSQLLKGDEFSVDQLPKVKELIRTAHEELDKALG